jgi:ribose 5-phosphate isomerase B
MRIALGSDHRGAELIRGLIDYLAAAGHEPMPLGENSGEPCDYPDGAYLVGKAVANGEADFGILACGSAVGVSMAANKVRGIRAALACDVAAAEFARRHNDANVLCISGDRKSLDEAKAMTDAFLTASFEGGRHARRVAKIRAIEAGKDPAEAASTS